MLTERHGVSSRKQRCSTRERTQNSSRFSRACRRTTRGATLRPARLERPRFESTGWRVHPLEDAMIDHTGVSVSDAAKSRRFYEQALAPLGYQVAVELAAEHTGGVIVLGFG